MTTTTKTTQWDYSRWRHGGWYVHNVRYPSGAVGCVSRNYHDRKWRIVDDPRPFEDRPTFKTRDEAAAAEYEIVQGLHAKLPCEYGNGADCNSLPQGVYRSVCRPCKARASIARATE